MELLINHTFDNGEIGFTGVEVRKYTFDNEVLEYYERNYATAVRNVIKKEDILSIRVVKDNRSYVIYDFQDKEDK